MTRVTSPAASRRIPVGSPAASRSICPPAGSGVSRPTPAASSANEFASPMWPSGRTIQTGFRGVAGSISCREGSGCPGHRS